MLEIFDAVSLMVGRLIVGIWILALTIAIPVFVAAWIYNIGKTHD